jgi:hypothetical protein
MKLRSKLLIVTGYLVLAAGDVAGFIMLDQEVKTRCRVSEESRKVLRDEHTVKLQRAEKYLRENPNGAPGIPRRLILDGIQDEKNILRHVQPRPCK